MTRADYLVIADDLTGACDSAVHFASAGRRTVVTFTPDCAPADTRVLALSTESRDLDPALARRRIGALAFLLRTAEPRIVFKKIDSTLRGNSGFEIVAALDAFGCEAAIVNPAFPAMSRVVEDGSLRVTTDPRFTPIEIAAWLHSNGANSCRHVSSGEIGTAIDGGAHFVSFDATSHDDLVRAAAEVMSLGRRILWAGSAGMASALASLEGRRVAAILPAVSRGPVLFCLGSDHPVTMKQQERLLAERDTVLLDPAATSPELLDAALADGHHVVLRIPREEISLQQLGALISECRPAALFLSGGDTASVVLRALDAQAIELRCEFAPGIPAGILLGGRYDGMTVITKSGGFGIPEDLIKVADYFHA